MAEKPFFNNLSKDSLGIIVEAIRNNKILSLYDGVQALLNLRSTLQTSNQSPEILTETEAVELTIGELAVYLAEWSGIGQVAGQLHLQGAIDSRGEILRLAAPVYDKIDAPESLSKVPLIGIVGRIASGKGTVGEIVRNYSNSMHLPLSDRLREFAITQSHFPPIERSQLREIDGQLKPKFGKQIFVDWTEQIAMRLAKRYLLDLVSIDGFRSAEEAQFFVDHGGVLIGVHTDDEVRYQRLVERNRGADDFTREAFGKSDHLERAWIDPIFSSIPPDYILYNNGTKEQLEHNTITILQKIGIPLKHNP